jgi:hypothetical protein
MYNLSMSLLLLLISMAVDIAPNPMIAKGIYPSKPREIRMESEVVTADLYHDKSIVNCTFEMVNYSGDTTIEVGFPMMDFQYWSSGGYTETDKSNFTLLVDGKKLTEKEIKVPQQVESIYNAHMKAYAANRENNRQQDSIYASYGVKYRKNGSLKFPKGSNGKQINDAAMAAYHSYSPQDYYQGNLYSDYQTKIRSEQYPWYVWTVNFKANEHKTIRVSYELPSGMSHAANYRYFKYILHTGSRWYKDIGQADIILKLHNIDMSKLEKISPAGYALNNKAKEVKWTFKNIEPTQSDDIYLQYYRPKERKAFEKRYGESGDK